MTRDTRHGRGLASFGVRTGDVALARALSALVAALARAVGCSDGTWRDESTATRGAILESLGTQVILPGLERLESRAGALAAATRALADAPDAGRLAAAREAWRDARSAWNRAEALLVDPPYGVALTARIDTAEVDRARIEEDIAGPVVLDAAYLEGLGATRNGFATLDYVLFAGDPVAVPRRAAYAAAAAAEPERLAHRIVALWSPAGENGLERFLSDDDPLQRIADRLAALTEVVADDRLVALDESPESRHGRADLADDLRGLRDVYTGRLEGRTVPALEDLVVVSAPPLRYFYEDAIDDAMATIEALEADPGESPQVALGAARAATRELMELTSVELSSALGTTLTFSPFDGD